MSVFFLSTGLILASASSLTKELFERLDLSERETRELASEVAAILEMEEAEAEAEAEEASEEDEFADPPAAVFHDLEEPIILEANNAEGVVVSHTGASAIKLHLQQEGLADCPGVELVVASPDGEESYVYDGEDFHEAGCDDEQCSKLHAMSVSSDTVYVSWNGPASNCEGLQVSVDGYSADDDESRRRVEEAICGKKWDWLDRECFTAFANPNRLTTRIVKGSGAVARIHPKGCTAWKLKGNFVLTNAHCCPKWSRFVSPPMFHDPTTGKTADISDRRWEGCDMSSQELWFRHEATSCGSTRAKKPIKVAFGDTLFYMKGKNGADFALITTKDEKAASQFGYIEMNAWKPSVGQTVFVAGHPARSQDDQFASGRFQSSTRSVKMISLYSENGRICKVTEVNDVTFKHNCDTTGGNSGSPVFAAESGPGPDGDMVGRAIGIHQEAGCNVVKGNGGTTAKYFWPIIKPIMEKHALWVARQPEGWKASTAKCYQSIKNRCHSWNCCKTSKFTVATAPKTFWCEDSRLGFCTSGCHHFTCGKGCPAGYSCAGTSNQCKRIPGQRVAGDDCIQPGYEYTRKVGGCVKGHNMLLLKNKSIEECKKACDDRRECKAFEYGVAHGGRKNVYKPRDCQLNSSANDSNCNGRVANLDLFIKQKTLPTFI